jgi:hypothetical protein
MGQRRVPPDGRPSRDPQPDTQGPFFIDRSYPLGWFGKATGLTAFDYGTPSFRALIVEVV